MITKHAQDNGEFFAHYPEREPESEIDSYGRNYRIPSPL